MKEKIGSGTEADMTIFDANSEELKKILEFDGRISPFSVKFGGQATIIVITNGLIHRMVREAAKQQSVTIES